MAEDRISRRQFESEFHDAFDEIDSIVAQGEGRRVVARPIEIEDRSLFKIKVYDKSMPEGRTLLFKSPIEFRNRASDGSFTVSDAGGRDIFFLEDGQWNGFGGRAPIHHAMANRFKMEKAEQDERRRRMWWRRFLAFMKTIYLRLDDLAEGRL